LEVHLLGNFYVNFATRGPVSSAIAKSLRSADRKAFVAPTVNDVTVFFDDKTDTQDESEIKALGERISLELDAPVLAVLNHDDDILAYWLFESGQLVDEYNSFPGYFSDGDNSPSGGNANKLCAAFGIKARKDVNSVLRNKEYVFAMERHQALSALLKLPWLYTCMGYRDIKEGSLPQGISERDLIRID
jgi:hypothetical protein